MFEQQILLTYGGIRELFCQGKTAVAGNETTILNFEKPTKRRRSEKLRFDRQIKETKPENLDFWLTHRKIVENMIGGYIVDQFRVMRVCCYRLLLK